MRKGNMEKSEKIPKPPRMKSEKPARVRKEKNHSGENGFKRTIGDVFRSKITIGFICLGISLLIAFVGVPIVQGYVSMRVPVVRAAANIGQGVQITADMLKVEDIAAIDKPSNAAQSIDQVVGAYAILDLLKEDLITANKLSREKPLHNQYLYDLPDNKQAIAVSVRGLAEGVSGKLKAGDIISVYAVFNRGDAEENYTAVQPHELKYMRVLAITNSDAQDIDVDSEKEFEADKNTMERKERLPSTVVLLAGDMQAAALAGIDHNATIHMALVARSDNEEFCKALLTEQDLYIESLNSVDEEAEEAADASESSGTQLLEPAADTPVDSDPQSGTEEQSNG